MRGPSHHATVTFDPQNGTTYWIQVFGQSGRSGPFDFSFNYAPVSD
jgi:hypothetical protein